MPFLRWKRQWLARLSTFDDLHKKFARVAASAAGVPIPHSEPMHLKPALDHRRGPARVAHRDDVRLDSRVGGVGRVARGHVALVETTFEVYEISAFALEKPS